jgi:hypothetical protein
MARSQYDPDGIAYDSSVHSSLSSIMTVTTSTAILSTTIVIPTIQINDMNKLNGTATKRRLKKGILLFVI